MTIGHDFLAAGRKLRVAVTPRSWLIKTKLPDNLVIRGSNRHGYGGRGIYIYRDQIEPEFGDFTKFLPDEGVMVDIGACTGIYGLRAARHFANRGTVIAIEPVPEIFAMLSRNVAENGLQNVRCRSFCIGEETGVETFWLNNGTPNSYSLSVREGESEGIPTFVVSLDDLVRWEGLERLDYMKIDAEGSELAILRGGKRTLNAFRPIIQAEIFRKHLETLELPGYVTYAAAHGGPNVVLIPEEHPKRSVAEALGWERL